MKIIINESQYNVLISINEVRVRQVKSKIGSGMSHYVYASNSNPNIVYKIGEIKEVDKWYTIFKSNPKIFPKVYKRGIIDIAKYKNLNDGNYYVSYVILEKLDTKTFEDFWGVVDEYFDGSLDELLNQYNYNKTLLVSISKLIKKYEGDGIYMKLLELYKLVESMLKIKNNSDIHIFQFGYDKRGKLKCLDI